MGACFQPSPVAPSSKPAYFLANVSLAPKLRTVRIEESTSVASAAASPFAASSCCSSFSSMAEAKPMITTAAGIAVAVTRERRQTEISETTKAVMTVDACCAVKPNLSDRPDRTALDRVESDCATAPGSRVVSR